MTLVVVMSLPAALARAEAPNSVKQFVQAYCVSCHGSQTQEGDFRLDTFHYELTARNNREQWDLVRDYVADGEMPPAKAKKHPNKEAVEGFLASLDRDMNVADRVAKPGGTPIRRLNRIEYLNTLHDLFPDLRDIRLPDSFPDDSTNEDFDTMPEGLFLSGALLKAYIDTAVNVANQIVPLPTRDTIHEKRDFSQYDRANKATVSYRAFSGFNTSMSRGAYYDPVVVARQTGNYAIRLQVRAQGKAGIDGKPLRLDFHAVNPALIHQPLLDRWHKWRMPQVGFVDVENVETDWVEVNVTLMKGEVLSLWCANRLPKAMYTGLTSSQERQANISKAKRSPLPTVELHKFEIQGPVGLAPYQKAFLGNKPPSKDRSYVESVLLPFAKRAWRRPLSDPEKDSLISSVEKQMKLKDVPIYGINYGVRKILCSPAFLYRATGPSLDEFDLASRLSYFLWSSMPDAELHDLARQKELPSPQVLRQQVLRMLKHKNAREFTTHFTGQWLSNREANERMICDQRYQWNHLVRYGYIKSTEMFFQEILDKNLPITTFIDSDFTYANDPMRLVWGYPFNRNLTSIQRSFNKGSTYPPVSRIDLKNLAEDAPEHMKTRGGVLGLPSVLMATGDGVESSPILRGVWVLENLFGTPPPPPPDDVPAIDIDTSKATNLREIISAHTASSKCASCHKLIDPLGLAMENYDAIGGWRDSYALADNAGAGKAKKKGKTKKKGQPKVAGQSKKKGKGKKQGLPIAGDASATAEAIDASSTLHDGTELNGAQDIKDYLLNNRDMFTKCLTTKLLEYACGRRLSIGDRRIVEEIVKSEPARGYLFRDLVVKAVLSEVFATK